MFFWTCTFALASAPGYQLHLETTMSNYNWYVGSFKTLKFLVLGAMKWCTVRKTIILTSGESENKTKIYRSCWFMDMCCSVLILDFWGPYAKLCCRGGGGGSWIFHPRMDETHFPCFTPSRIMLTESARETVPLPRLGTLSTRFFCKIKRLYDIHVTCIGWFLHRDGNNAPHKNKWSFMFS